MLEGFVLYGQLNSRALGLKGFSGLFLFLSPTPVVTYGKILKKFNHGKFDFIFPLCLVVKVYWVEKMKSAPSNPPWGPWAPILGILTIHG